MANSVIWPLIPSDTVKPVVLHVGDSLRVHYKLIEKEKVAGKTKREVKVETHERIQVFEGLLLAIKGGNGVNTMLTVRHIGAGGIGVERLLPLASPWIKKIGVKKLGDVRRAKLYYVRTRIGKEANRVNEAVQSSPTA